MIRTLDRSKAFLRFLAWGTLAAFVAGCLAIWYWTATIFICPDECASHPGLGLWAIAIGFGAIPAIGTGAIGFFITRGLFKDIRRLRDEEAAR